MPIGMVVFGDKTYTDLHGTLSVTPFFTLTFFNRAAWNNPSVWRPLAHILNLSHGRGETDKKNLSTKCQDERKCLAVAFKDL